jgi:hypothetical protein
MRNDLRDWLDEKVEGERKPLYLSGGGELTVDLDGPALRVRQEDRAAMCYPLARVGRVISRGSVKWDSDALLACAKTGIPVLFQLHDTEVCGFLFGWSASDDALFRALRTRLGRPGGGKVYLGWQRAMTEQALIVLAQQMPEMAGANSAEDWRCRLGQCYQRYVDAESYAALTQRLRALLGALSAQLLMEAGLDALRTGRVGVNLVGDLAGLLDWALQQPVLTALQGHRQKVAALNLADDRQLTRLFEAQAVDLRRLGQDLLGELQRRMAE